MKSLIWRYPESCKNKHIMDYNWRPMKERTSSSIFRVGKYLPCPDVGGIKCSIDPKEYSLIFQSACQPKEFLKFDCLPNNGPAPLVNQKVLDIFNKLCPNDIQAFQATIIPDKKSKNSFENHDYWLINITKQMDVIDLENSVFSSFKEDPSSIFIIKRLTFLNNIDPDVNFIARISNYHSLEIVSPSLAKAFKDAKVTGVRFIEDKEYS